MEAKALSERRGHSGNPPTGSRRVRMAACCLPLVVVAGCMSGARLELAAADSLDALAGAMTATLIEYHEDVELVDAARRRAAVAAIIDRLRADIANQDAVDQHAAEFDRAIERLWLDRETEWRRFTVGLENAASLREIGEGLHRRAIESLSLEDEAKRYFGELIEARRAASQEPTSGPQP